MDKPVLGFNKEESYIEFTTSEGKLRLGLRDLRFYIQDRNGNKTYLTDLSGVSFAEARTGEVFNGVVDLSSYLRIYDELTVDEALAISFDSTKLIPGGYAEVNLIGDGETDPTFAGNMIATPSSSAYDLTLGAFNKIGFYYDGKYVYYTITVITLPV